MTVGRAVAAAAVVGAAAAALTASDGRRLSVCFLRWARDTDRSKAEAAAAAAKAALASADQEARREREAWESLQAALEGSAAAREREAREAAEEAARKVRAPPPPPPVRGEAAFVMTAVGEVRYSFDRAMCRSRQVVDLARLPKVGAEYSDVGLDAGPGPQKPPRAKRRGGVFGESHQNMVCELHPKP